MRGRRSSESVLSREAIVGRSRTSGQAEAGKD